MRREVITERIDTRPNDSPGDDITMAQHVDVYLGGDVAASLRVEYKPDRYLLPEGAFEGLASEGFFEGEDSSEPTHPEAVVSDVYWALIDLLYPKHSYLDEPWHTLPLVVEVEHGVQEWEDHLISLGTFK